MIAAGVVVYSSEDFMSIPCLAVLLPWVQAGAWMERRPKSAPAKAAYLR
jgi:hypothetical protein